MNLGPGAWAGKGASRHAAGQRLAPKGETPWSVGTIDRSVAKVRACGGSNPTT